MAGDFEGLQRQKLEAKDKVVHKMGRDGLMEENLRSREAVRASRREADAPMPLREAERPLALQKPRICQEGQGSGKGKRRRGLGSLGKAGGNGCVRGAGTEGEPLLGPFFGQQDACPRALEHPLEKDPADPEEASPARKPQEEGRPQAGPAAAGQTGAPAGPALGPVPYQTGHKTWGSPYTGKRMAGEPKEETREASCGKEGSQSPRERTEKRMERPEGRPSWMEKVEERPPAREKLESNPRKEEKNSRKAPPERQGLVKRRAEEGMPFAGRPPKEGKGTGSPLPGKEEEGRGRKEKEKRPSRLSFGDEDGGMVRGAGAGMARAAAATAGNRAEGMPYPPDSQEGKERQDSINAACTERTEGAGRRLFFYPLYQSSRGLRGRNARLRNRAEETEEGTGLQLDAVPKRPKAGTKEAEARKKAGKRLLQKKRQKERLRTAGSVFGSGPKTGRAAWGAAGRKRCIAPAPAGSGKEALWGGAAVLLLILSVMSMLWSCGGMLQGGLPVFVGTTYASSDEEIHAAEAAYCAMEEALDEQIRNIESVYPGYDRYIYQVDEISHDPYQLISYLTALYGDFTYAQVEEELTEIFRQQYGLASRAAEETVTEEKTVTAGEALGEVMTSGYCSCAECCGRQSDGTTASGTEPTEGRTVAVDAEDPIVPIGTKVVMNGVEYVAEDTGNLEENGVQFDVYYEDHASAAAHGHQAWEAYLSDSNGDWEVEVSVTKREDRLYITLTNYGLDTVLRSRMDEDEEGRYGIYCTTYGNRNYLFDINSLPEHGGGDGEGAPPEGLSDMRFANMLREAEKHLGRPYVWGGDSPEPGFDCSGFVCWVVNHCGNGWDVGRQSAEGLRQACTAVPASEAKPGDLVFFQGTYGTPGASHVGIHVGNGRMIHCGDPVQYANIQTPYWRRHFLSFGRIS